MELMVVDASVAAKWVLTEPDSAAANELLDGRFRLTAPALIQIEVTGAAIRRFRLGKIDLETSRAACQKWDRLIDDCFVGLLPIERLYAEAVDLSFRCRHALADCLYLAAARSLNCPLMTADRTFFERAKPVYPAMSLFAKAA